MGLHLASCPLIVVTQNKSPGLGVEGHNSVARTCTPRCYFRKNLLHLARDGQGRVKGEPDLFRLGAKVWQDKRKGLALHWQLHPLLPSLAPRPEQRRPPPSFACPASAVECVRGGCPPRLVRGNLFQAGLPGSWFGTSGIAVRCTASLVHLLREAEYPDKGEIQPRPPVLPEPAQCRTVVNRGAIAFRI